MLQLLVIALIVLIGVLILFYSKRIYINEGWQILAFLLFVTAFIWGILWSVLKYDANNNVQIFNQQTIYLVSHKPKNDLEDAALTQKKLELNSWLYSAQYDRKTFGDFSMFDNSILSLEPIQ